MPRSEDELRQSLQPAFRIAPPGQVNLYTILESELETLERGAPDSPLLPFGTFLLGAGVSFGVALATVSGPSLGLLVFLWVATLLGLINGGVLLAIWRLRRSASFGVATRIRARQPPVVEAQLASEGEVQESEQGEDHA